MASSQVEIASSSPFGCVLRDHNRRDRYSRESNARATQAAAFQKNLKDLVHNHLHSCMSGPTRCSASDSNENSYCQSHNANLWVHNAQGSNQRNSHLSNANDNNNNANNRRQLKVVDRWARAREIVFSMDTEIRNGIPSRASTFQGENSPCQLHSSAEIPNVRGVSSLVQRWRDFEAEKKSLNSIISPFCGCSRSNSGSTSAENASVAEAPTRGSDAGESADERYETPSMAEDSFGDWESDRTATSCPPSCQGRDLDAAERERVRVADIIRKLSFPNRMQQGSLTAWDDQPLLDNPSTRVRTPLDQAERNFYPVLHSPRLRGRQAFNDLLLQMERDRHRELEILMERRAVSRFSHRGRIQALLRVRFLRRGAEAGDRRRPNSTVVDTNRTAQGSTIMHLRERFDTGVEHGAAESRSPGREVVDNTPEMEKPSTSSQLRENVHRQEVTQREVIVNMVHVEISSMGKMSPAKDNHVQENCSTSQQSTQVLHLEDLQEVVSPRSHANRLGTNHEVGHSGPHEPAVVAASLDGWDEYRNAEEQDVNNQQLTGNQDWITSISGLQTDCEEHGDNHQQFTEIDCDWISDVCHPQSDWEEQSNYQLEETNHDWITDISRPQSEWEGLRQARYLEMLDPYLDNGERRELLERKSVSNFLSSNLRECIDKLMVSRMQGYPHPVVSHEEAEEQEEEQQLEEEGIKQDDVVEEEAEEKEMIEEELGNNNGDYDDGEAESPTRQQYNEVGDYSDQTSRPHIPYSSNSWSHNQDPEGGEDYDQVVSPSLQPSLASNSYTQDNRQCFSFMNHPSIEMELIYDLRGHMEQLRQEMSELRQSINSCMNMQATLQQSIKEEVAAASSHSAPGEGKYPLNRVPRKGNCCVCYKEKVDSLLYRCGHMCTCFKCSHELQWSSGKCPICQAPIMDVVRVYADL